MLNGFMYNNPSFTNTRKALMFVYEMEEKA